MSSAIATPLDNEPLIALLATPFTQIREVPGREPTIIDRDSLIYQVPFSNEHKSMHRSGGTMNLDPFRGESYRPGPISAELNSADTEVVSPGSTEDDQRALLPRLSATSARNDGRPTSTEHGSTPLANDRAWYLASLSDITSQPPPEYQR